MEQENINAESKLINADNEEKVNKIDELTDIFELRNNFSSIRHDEKKELINLRHNFSLELLNLRDNISTKRHSERLEIFKRKAFN